ncbi:MAG TPA: SDR family oxidoreductase [Candidatus Limnocylindrales bacterium]|nr:SDR family oxidoreductase [Candidatus Limnocylindrales bacterium]
MTQIALITGANKGIGYETARLLAERGMTVLLGARDPELGRAAADKLGVEFIRIDVTDEVSIRDAATYVKERYGRLDVLVNNAGIARADGDWSPSATTLATMRAVYETNVFGVVAVTNAMLPLLRMASTARIVNVSSEVGSIAQNVDPDSPISRLTSIPYPSSKTALNMITVQYAKELRDTPIKVNAANPGYCATDLNGNSGFRTATQGAEISVHLATLPDDGPTGKLWGNLWTAGDPEATGVLPW